CCENVGKSREKLQQCMGIPEPGALWLHQRNTEQQKETSPQVEKAQQQDRMEVSQEQESSSRALEQLRQQSSGQGHALAQVCREKELLGQEKAALKGRLAAMERHRQELCKQLAETRSAKESLESSLSAAQQQISQLEMSRNHLEAQVLRVTQAKAVVEGQVKFLQQELEAERALRRKEQEERAQQFMQAEQHHESLRLQGTAQQMEINKLLQDLASRETLLCSARFLKRKDLQQMLRVDQTWRFGEGLLAQDRSRAAEHLHRALMYLDSPQESLRAAAIRFI
ncbi:centrosome-associated protein CEP250-like, partial [Cyanistes caeruleus]|uniref:centrosome-associated protein CEP250-like n=1 Tax=Cyanistes caeruleus TaxID=156563 RepID=UPI000CDA0B53